MLCNYLGTILIHWYSWSVVVQVFSPYSTWIMTGVDRAPSLWCPGVVLPAGAGCRGSRRLPVAASRCRPLRGLGEARRELRQGRVVGTKRGAGTRQRGTDLRLRQRLPRRHGRQGVDYLGDEARLPRTQPSTSPSIRLCIRSHAGPGVPARPRGASSTRRPAGPKSPTGRHSLSAGAVTRWSCRPSASP
jgi:hypothetical protein